MRLKIKQEFKNNVIYSPKTGRKIDLSYLNQDQLLKIYDDGYEYLFEGPPEGDVIKEEENEKIDEEDDNSDE